MRLHTTLCDVLGIEHPIVQSGMGGIAGPDLVAAVSHAGALGIIAGLNVAPEDLRKMIRRVREVTDRPFGVNLWLHPALRPPTDPATLPEADVRGVQSVLNRFRDRLGVARTTARPAPLPNFVEGAFDVVVDERVPVFSVALGDPGRDMVAACHARGVKVMGMVVTVDDARALDASGVDVIVAQGGEAGGHRSIWTKPVSIDAASIGAMALVPQIVDAVSVPVVAAGGIADGRGLVAALALGAAGVLLGTRFVATRESAAPEFYKKSLLEREADSTTITDAFTGVWARALANTFSREYTAAGAPVLPPVLQRATAQDVYNASAARHSGEYYPMWAGHSVGLIRDLPGATDVVQAIVREARAVIDRLPR